MVAPSGSASSHENAMTIGTSTAISASMTSAMPSIPSANRVPNAGIQSTANSSWNRTPSSASVTE